MSAEDKLRAYVIERLMCCGDVDTAQAGHAFAFGGNWCRHELRHLQTMADDGLVQIDGPVVRLTDRGRPLARLAASVFDSYRQHADSRHSVAI